jgi:hypothetical protein
LRTWISITFFEATSMSIYRKFARDATSDVHVNTVTRQVETPAATNDANEEAEKSKRRKSAPMDAPLPRTFTWVAKLPRDVQPVELMRLFPRIANLLASAWDDREATHGYFDELLHDRRGNRKGFPPEVMAELLALHTHYAGLNPKPMASWEHLTKR